MSSSITQLYSRGEYPQYYARVPATTDLSVVATAAQNTGRGVVTGATGKAAIAGADAFVKGILAEVESATYWWIIMASAPVVVVRAAGALGENVWLTTDASGDFTTAGTGEEASFMTTAAVAAADSALPCVPTTHIAE